MNQLTHLKKDPVLFKIIAQTTLPENNSTGNVFIALIRSITGQQLSVKVAKVIYGRLIDHFDGIDPEPHQLLTLDVENLRSIGYSRNKASYILNVASFFEEVSYDYEYWNVFTSEDIIKRLTEIKGIGKWTVEMILMFTLEREDVFPLDDYGIQVAVKKHYGIVAEKKELKQKMSAIAEAWVPYRTLASRYLWASLNNEPG